LTSTADTAALVAEVDAGNFQILTLDIFPNIHFRPVGEGEDAHILAWIETAIVEIPDFGTLVLRIPLTEAVTKTEETFLCTSFFLITAGSSYAAVKSELLDGRKEDGDLKLVAADLTG
jgi:hypothetical protein